MLYDIFYFYYSNPFLTIYFVLYFELNYDIVTIFTQFSLHSHKLFILLYHLLLLHHLLLPSYQLVYPLTYQTPLYWTTITHLPMFKGSINHIQPFFWWFFLLWERSQNLLQFLLPFYLFVHFVYFNRNNIEFNIIIWPLDCFHYLHSDSIKKEFKIMAMWGGKYFLGSGN